jgi:beta-phosphoglucomutase-like phosphatase (HAD superfamily)
LLKAAEVEDLMQEKATASDAKRSKPDPDIVDAAIEKSGVSPRNLVMIGDTPYDIEAATRAGVRIIAFRSGGWEGGLDRFTETQISPPAQRRDLVQYLKSL